jgi:two-component system response regulator MtrA
VDEHVLVVEDDPSLRESAALVLERAGMRVVGEGDGPAALRRFDEGRFDLVVLDLMLPGMSGFDVCRELRRRSRVPIVILTARTATADLVTGLELGADDYITKPLDGPELLARTRAVLRRASPESDDRTVTAGDIEVDPLSFRAYKDGGELELTTTEFRLLFELVRHAGHVLSRETLLRRVWNYDYLGESRLVDMAVKRLREKIEDEPRQPTRLVTIRGVGYRYERR